SPPARRSLGARRPGDTVVAVRPRIALRTRAVVDVAHPVLVHVLGREVARAVLVQVPAVMAIATGVAGRTLRAVVTLRTLRSRSAVAPRGPIRSRGTRNPVVTRVALESLGTRIAGNALRALRTLRTLGTGRAHRTLRTHRTVRTHRPRPAGGAGTACRTLGSGRVELNLPLLALLALDDLAL